MYQREPIQETGTNVRHHRWKSKEGAHTTKDAFFSFWKKLSALQGEKGEMRETGFKGAKRTHWNRSTQRDVHHTKNDCKSDYAFGW